MIGPPSFPTTIEVSVPRSRIADRARRKASSVDGRRLPPTDSGDDGDDDDGGGGSGDEYDAGGGHSSVPPSDRRGGRAANNGGGIRAAYESFGVVGENSLDLTGSIDHSLDDGTRSRGDDQSADRSLPLDEMRHHRGSRHRRSAGGQRRQHRHPSPPPPSLQHHHHHPPSSQQQVRRKPQVLVHYHPQLGDTGYESTLLDPTPPSPSLPRPSTNWMHTRAIDYTREEEGGLLLTRHHDQHRGGAAVAVPPPRPPPPRLPGGGGGPGGNDEHNNAATRQIRRRVLRAAMERSARDWGAHDERRRKMSEADADVGGAPGPAAGRGGGGGGSSSSSFSALPSPVGGVVDLASSDAFRSPGSVDSAGGASRTAPGSFGSDAFFRSPGTTTATARAFADDDGGSAAPAVVVDDGPLLSSPVSPLSPPTPPPSRPPSYKTLVADLIAKNEPEKLSQVDRVMEKYAGREEELIKKLDLRYRRKRTKSVTRQPGAQNPDGGDEGREEKPQETSGGAVDGGKGGWEEKLGRRPPPQSTSMAKAPTADGDDDFKPFAVIETRVLSPPKKLTFIKVEKASVPSNKSRGAATHGWDNGEGTDGRDLVRHDADYQVKMAATSNTLCVGDGGKDGDDRDESAMPPKITKKGLHNRAISDSTKTAVHANRGGWMEEADANPDMIPLSPSVNVNLPNLGNQVEIERMELEEKFRSRDASDAGAVDGGNNKDEKGERHDDDDQDEFMMPPKIAKMGLPRSISDSTQKTMVRATRVGWLEEDDANSGMIPYTPAKNVNSTNSESQVEIECTKLEEKRRQLAEKRTQLEEKMLASKKIEEGKEVKSPQSASAKSPQSASAISSDSAQDKLENISGSPPNLGYDYKLRRTTSKSSYTSKAFDDGISVMTMETKSTLPLRATHRVGDGDAIYSFDEMLKRPPNSIIVESSGSASDGVNVDKPQTTISKLQRVIPEIETEDEKAKLVEASSEAAAKLDNVEARIRARYRLMEEEAAKKKENEMKAQRLARVDQTSTLMETHDELSDMESMFREAKSKSSLQVDYSEQDEGKEEEEVDKGTAMETAEVEKKEEIAVADEQIIQSILSSYDEEDQSLCASVVNAHPGPRKEDTDLQTITSSHALDDMGTRQVLMKTFSTDVSSPSLDKGGDSIVSAMSQHSTSMMAIAVATRTELKRLREVAAFNQQQQGDATIHSGSRIGDIHEEEITRLIAEKESRFQAEQAVALLKAQRELEAERRARLEAETAKMRAEIELQHLKWEKMRKEEEKLADQGVDSGIDQEQAGDVAAAAPLEPSEEKPSSNSPGPFLGQNQLGLKKYKLEEVVTAVESPRVKAEEQLESVNTDEMVKEDEVVEKLPNVSRAIAQQEQPLPDAIDQSRLEAEATRLQAEKELELLRAKRATVLTLEYDEIDLTENKSDLSRTNSEQDADDIEIFRHVYSSDDDSVSRHSEAVVDEAPQHLSEEDENRRKFKDMMVTSKSSSDESEGVEVAEPAQIGKSETSAVASDVAERIEPNMKSLSLENEILEATGQESSSEALGQESTSPRKDAVHVAAKKNESVDEEVETNERDFPLEKSKPAVPMEIDEEVEAVIHHVAVVTFEGNPGKGQLSFITGSKIEAHSNQCGPWWLGRCGTRTGWFPARAVVPESEFLARFKSPSGAVADYDESEEVAPLSGDELHAVYDLIRNPSDQSEQNRDGDDSGSESGSPARSRWLDTGAGKSNTAFSSSRDHSPPPTRSDPSEMAGLTERLYGSNDDDSSSKTNEGLSPSPISSMPDDMSKIDTIDASEPLSNTPSGGAAKEPQPSVDAPKPKPKGDWRAVRDPNSGLIYYYHVITKEVSYVSPFGFIDSFIPSTDFSCFYLFFQTTWEKPPGFVSRQAAAERKSPKADSREKSKGRKGIGIINFLTKITKPTSPASPTKASGKPLSPSVSEAKNDDPTRDRNSAKSEKLEVDDLGEIEQKDSWLTLDDKVAESDDDSESSEDTYASITKRKIKSVRKWAGKITEKLNSPPSQPYKKWDDGTEEPQDSAVSSAKDQLKESPSVRSIDEPPQKQKDPEQPIQSESGDVVDREGQLATEDEPKEQVTQDSTAEDAPTFKSSDTDVFQADPPVLVVNAPMTPSRKQPDWRSAIDHATGRTYYYIRGTSKVTWERPSDMS